MNKKKFFIFCFLVILSNSCTLFSMKKPPIPKSPRFRTSETLESFISDKKCLLCGKCAKEKESIECLDCGNRVHVECAFAYASKNKKNIDPRWNCLHCSKN